MTTCPVRGCRDSDDEPTTITPAEAVCGRHRRRVAVCLAELPRLYVELALAMVPGATQSDADRVTTSQTPPLALNVEARALQEDMVKIATGGEDAHRRARGWTRRARRGREGATLVASVIFCQRNLDELLGQPFGAAFALDTLRAVGSARRTLGLVRLVHTLPAPCPSCDSMALERRDGDDVVCCRYCGRSFSEDDYARLVLILASDLAAS